MIKVSLEKFGAIVSDQEVGGQILSLIKSSLGESESIEIDLSSIKSMATFCAKQIFGELYIKMGPESFFERVKIINASNDIRLLIKIGIQSAIEESRQ